ncbi:MAG: BamA/TamA family outer membrane protein, partial [Vicinamibacteria bacterium]
LAAVEIEAPGEDAAALRAIVELKPGAAYDPEAVRHAVELLYATGRYEDVVVETSESAAGLLLRVRPRPAPLLGPVALEGDRVLAPADLLRLSRLRDGEPLWPARLEKAARDVAVALTEDGWLEAQVRADARREGRTATAVFTVRAGTRVRVTQATVEGAPAALVVELNGRVRPRRGQPFRRAEATRAAESMRGSLRRGGYGRARVEVREAYDPAVGAMRLTFAVAAGARLRLETTGDPLPDPRLRARLARLVRDGGAESDALEEGRDLLEQALVALGHRQAAVSYRFEQRADGEVAVYDVSAGPLAIVDSVRVSAEQEAGLPALLLTRADTPLQDRVTDADARTLARALEDRGYPEARVEVEVQDGGGRLPVLFRVQEGQRVTVGSVTIDAPVALPATSAPRELRMRAGAPYRVRDLARDRMNLLSAYRDGGYPDADVVPEVTRGPDGTAAVVLHVQARTRVDVDHIVVSGLEHTKEAVVRRELTLKEGEPLGLDRLLESQRRLSALGIFDRVSVSEIDPESKDARSLRVHVEEAPRITVAYGIGSAENDPLRGSVEVTRRNLFGMDRSLSTFARVSFQGSRFLTTYREPFLFGRRQELFVTGFREEEDRAFFDFVRFGGFVQGSRPLPAGSNLIARYTYQQTDAFNIENPGQVGREFTTSTFSGPTASVVNDTRDDPLDPRRGHFLSADVQLSHRLLGGDTFLKGFVQGAVYRRLDARTVVAASARLGLARTFGLEESLFLPRPDRFYAGGDYSLRGFEADTVEPLGGNAMMLGGAELRFSAGRSFSPAVFADAGNVYRLVSDFDLGNLRYSAGFGLRYRTAFGPIRVDWAFKLNRRGEESRSHVHLTIGHAF